MRRKSNTRTYDYRTASPSHAEKLATFKQQMADVARGERMLKLRDDKHWSQATAAHKIGVSEKTVRSWEQGGRIKWRNARSAGRVYGVDPESLVDRDESEEVSPEEDERREADDDLESKVDRLLVEVAGLRAEQTKLLATLATAEASKRVAKPKRTRPAQAR